MALDESFKRPGTVPFKWELQPGIPKQHQQEQDPAAGAAGDAVPPATAPTPTPPRLALPPAARAGALAPASRRRASSSFASAAAPLSPPAQPSHRRSMSARFATSLALMSFTRRGRGGGGGRAGAAKDDATDFCLLYADRG